MSPSLQVLILSHGALPWKSFDLACEQVPLFEFWEKSEFVRVSLLAASFERSVSTPGTLLSDDAMGA